MREAQHGNEQVAVAQIVDAGSQRGYRHEVVRQCRRVVGQPRDEGMHALRRDPGAREISGAQGHHGATTGLGSTGWLKSIYAGWRAATRTLLHQNAGAIGGGSFPWDADYLHYFVRQPYPSRVTGADIVIGRIGHAEHLILLSQMPEHGVIFSDGMETDHLDFNSGTEARIGIANKQGMLVA